MFYLILKVEVEKQKKIVVTTLFSKELFAKQKKWNIFLVIFSFNSYIYINYYIKIFYKQNSTIIFFTVTSEPFTPNILSYITSTC